ncbi:CAP domain-containing protein [Neobacillus sp. SM06]|uniref:CAP domain-containing protein n=1 Tax=Neobacillus sp. SM06 TaxID=3422492 RepID=UPI003D2E3BCD
MPLRILTKILILLAIFLTIGFYSGLNGKGGKEVLIKDHSTPKIKKQEVNNDTPQTKAPVSVKAKEGLSLLIGKDVQTLEKELGQPKRIDPSIYGYDWYIYNQSYNSYVQIGVQDGRVVTVYAIGQNLDVAPFEIGQSVEEIFNTHYIDANVDIKLDGNTYRFELNDTDLNLRPLIQLGDIYVQLYIDKFTGSLSSVRFLDAETIIKQRPYGLVYRGQLIEMPTPTDSLWRSVEKGEEQEIFDLTNILRVRHNLKPLKWDQKTANVAYEHSKDMVVNNDFSHTSKKFGSLSDRLNTAKVVFQSAGENIAANYSDAPAVVEGWLNSKGHRDALLNKEFSYLGVGVYQKYYTQNFIQKWEQ